MSIADSLIAPQPAPPAPPRRFTVARFAGILFMALWVALFASILINAIEGFDQEKFFKYGPAMLRGLVVTIQLVATSLVLGAILSLPLAFARMQPSGVLASLAYGYVYLFRGTPLIMQVFLIYYGLGSFRPELDAIGVWWFFRDAYKRAPRLHAQHGRLSGRDPARGDPECGARPVGGGPGARPPQAADLHSRHPAPGADGGAPPLRQ